MTINFENYGNFYVGLNYVDGTDLAFGSTTKPVNFKEAVDFIESKVKEDLTIVDAFICDAYTGEVVATIEKENEDFADDENWYADEWRDDYDECGFNPYMGCYDFDC